MEKPEEEKVSQGESARETKNPAGIWSGFFVPKAGLEPAQLAPHAPETCVSTNSTTSAILNLVPGTGLEPAQLAPYAPQTYVSTNFTTRAGKNQFRGRKSNKTAGFDKSPQQGFILSKPYFRPFLKIKAPVNNHGSFHSLFPYRSTYLISVSDNSTSLLFTAGRPASNTLFNCAN